MKSYPNSSDLPRYRQLATRLKKPIERNEGGPATLQPSDCIILALRGGRDDNIRYPSDNLR